MCIHKNIIPYLRLQARINLRVALFMSTNSGIQANVPEPHGRGIVAGELDGVLAVRMLVDDVWGVVGDFL